MIINGTDLKMVRGDTEVLTVSCKDEAGMALSFVAGDEIYLTVKNHINDKTYVFQKKVTNFTEGAAVITIDPIDTQNMRISPNSVYDIQWFKALDSSVRTIVLPSKFILIEDVTEVEPEV